jgi:hypothetical protein
MRTLTLKEGLDIQAKDLARWKTKLTAEVYEDLERYANTDKENWSDGFDVKRGNTLSTFIANWNPFNFGTALREWGMNFGDECNGLLFNFDGSNNTITLRYPSSVIDKMIGLYSEVYFEVMVVGNLISMSMFINDKHEESLNVNYGKIPTNSKGFEEFTKFLIGQLCTVESKFAEVDECILDRDKLEYTVHGFLIPRQTIGFDNYSDWDCIKGVMGQPIFDCQIDDDEDENGIIYNFQIVDLNYDVDGGFFNLDDTPKVGGGYINRDYTGVHLVFKEEEPIEYCGLDKIVEVRNFKIGDVMYEVHIDATEERVMTNVYSANGEVTPSIMDRLEKYIEKIEI